MSCFIFLLTVLLKWPGSLQPEQKLNSRLAPISRSSLVHGQSFLVDQQTEQIYPEIKLSFFSRLLN